jgi:hypothetical protein
MNDPASEVVTRVVAEGGLDALDLFAQQWRMHFVDTMRPRFLPRGWNVMRPLALK